MSGYKVFQCDSMDYHLEPARYEKVAMTKLMARYELRMYCDWVGRLQTQLDATNLTESKLIDVEKLREGLSNDTNGFYSASAGSTKDVNNENEVESISAQWADLIDVILRNTAWKTVSTAVSEVAGSATGGAGTGPTGTRNVSQAKVSSELAYHANVQDTDRPEISATQSEGHPELRSVLGIKAVANGPAYDKECIADLINNSNMYDIVAKMRAHGCFIYDEDKAGGAGYVVNPFIKKGNDGGDQDTATLLDQDDELVFPINLMSVVGHTAADADEDLSSVAGMNLEINICFKQNVASGDTLPGHSTDILATTDSGTFAGTGPNNADNANNVA